MRKEYKFGCDGINAFAYDVLFILEANHGSRAGEYYFQPMPYFVNRAATRYIKNMLTYNPGKIASILEKGGSIDENIARLKALTEHPCAGRRTA